MARTAKLLGLSGIIFSTTLLVFNHKRSTRKQPELVTYPISGWSTGPLQTRSAPLSSENQNYVNLCENCGSKNINFIANAVESAMDSVVSLKMETKIPGFFEKNVLVSYGSGFIVREDGSILTNAHVVADLGIGGKLTITDSKGNRYKGYVFSIDHWSDLAVVKPDNPKASMWKPVAFGLKENLRPGDWVISIGSPLGLQNTVTVGIISAQSRRDAAVTAGKSRDTRLDFIQTDCVVHSGSSGGPLVNVNGKVIGINTTRAEREGITFAIRVDNAIHIIRQLMDSNQIKRPWFGFKMISLTQEVVEKFKESGINDIFPAVDKGILLTEVHPKSPAAMAGFLNGDVIVEINGNSVTETQDFHRILSDDTASKEVELSIKRRVPLDMDWDGRIRRYETESRIIKVRPVEIDMSMDKNQSIESYLVS